MNLYEQIPVSALLFIGAVLVALQAFILLLMGHPAADSFYRILSDEQKSSFNAIGPAGESGLRSHQQIHQ